MAPELLHPLPPCLINKGVAQQVFYFSLLGESFFHRGVQTCVATRQKGRITAVGRMSRKSTRYEPDQVWLIIPGLPPSNPCLIHNSLQVNMPQKLDERIASHINIHSINSCLGEWCRKVTSVGVRNNDGGIARVPQLTAAWYKYDETT